jgi:hypothetical protein
VLEQRKNQRFPIQQPVCMRIREEHGWRKLKGITENASSTGVFLLTDSLIPIGSEVELTITLAQCVRIYSPGKVVRVALHDNKVGIAVACTRPFAELRAS